MYPITPKEVAYIMEADIWKGKEKPTFSEEEARDVGESLDIDWDACDLEEFRMGLEVEMEHGTVDPQTDVTNDDLLKTGKIALIHLKEIPDYYTRLKKMEEEAES